MGKTVILMLYLCISHSKFNVNRNLIFYVQLDYMLPDYGISFACISLKELLISTQWFRPQFPQANMIRKVYSKYYT